MRKWLTALRLYSAPASLIPALLGLALPGLLNDDAKLVYSPLILLCAFFLHMGANVLNDYYDYLYKTDTASNSGKTNVIVSGLIDAASMLKAGWFFFAIAFIAGIPLIIQRGFILLIIGILGAIGGYFYSAEPVCLKKRALGEPAVFILMGPLITLGSYIAFTGVLRLEVVAFSLPIGFLVSAILNINNIRDRDSDLQNNIRTLPNITTFEASKYQYYFLIVTAYITVLILIWAKLCGVWCLLVLLSAPLAVRNLVKLKDSSAGGITSALVVETASLHGLFGALYIGGILLK